MPAVPIPPLPDAATVGVFAFGVLVGLAIPTGYGLERLSGFGRAVMSRLPYKAPPGMTEQQALRRTGQAAGDVPEEQDGLDGVPVDDPRHPNSPPSDAGASAQGQQGDGQGNQGA